MVAIHLIVDCDAIPTRGRIMIVRPVQRVRHAIERDGLIRQLVGRCPFHLNDQVVPAVVYGVAGNAGW